MHSQNHSLTRRTGAAVATATLFAAGLFAACSSKSGDSPGNDGGTSSGADMGCGILSQTGGGGGVVASAPIKQATSTCSAPGMATMGPADTHCATAGPDGGVRVQPTSVADCCDQGDGNSGPAGQCAYGATMYGMEANDDDCKYHVTWSSTPLCEGTPGVQFTVTAVYNGTQNPLKGANPMMEAFTTTSGDEDAATYCDDNSTHLSKTSGAHMTEYPPGTYTGLMQFDTPGQWTIRFHFNEECYDVAADSPHGHAAFHLTIP